MKRSKLADLPEGAMSLESIERVYLTRLLEEGGAGDLVPVLSAFAHGQLLEGQGKYKEAGKLYKESLKKNPNNFWMKEASRRVQYILN